MEQTKNNAANFKANKEFAESNTGLIETVLNKCGISWIGKVEVAPAIMDKKYATDYIIKTTRGFIAARVRRDTIGYRDWTIRNVGEESELDKLKKGYAYFYVYIWRKKDADYDYILIDLDKVRAAGLLDLTWPETTNPDGTKFIAISIKPLIKHDCIISAKGILEWEKPTTQQRKLF